MKFIARRDGVDLEVEVQRLGTGYRVRVGDRWLNADVVEAGFVRSLRLEDGRQFSLTHHRDGNTHEISFRGGATARVEVIDPLALKRRRREDETGAGGVIKALMPGRVVRIMVNPGDTVSKGAGLLILEAMKMENEIQAPADGTVDQIFVNAGQTVESGADLLLIS